MKIGCGTFCVLLFLLFLGLKLGEVGVVAQWSWIAVTAPLWGFAVLLITVFFIVLFSLIIAGIVNDK